MTIETINLAFGARDTIPADATAAWGARAIVTQDGMVDFVPGRSDRIGDDTFLQRLGAEFGQIARVLEGKLRSGEIKTREDLVHTVFSDNGITVVANAQESGGYLYISAWEVRS